MNLVAILKLQQDGEIQEFYEKWWKTGQKNCPPAVLVEDELKLNLFKLGGVFLVVFSVLCISLFSITFEFFWRVKKNSKGLIGFISNSIQIFKNIWNNFSADVNIIFIKIVWNLDLKIILF